MAGPLYPTAGRFRILVGMERSKPWTLRHPLVLLLGSALLVVGAGMAAARTQGGPPWAQDATDCEATTTDGVVADPTVAEECETDEVSDGAGGVVQDVDLEQTSADVEAYFGAFDNECGAEILGEYDLADQPTLEAFDGLMTSLESGQTSHMVQSVRVLLENCADHPNDGLMNALYHHGLNWVRHYEHEQWLQEKFAARWPDGKPGKPEGLHGNPHELHGNPHELQANAHEPHGNPHTAVGGSSNPSAYAHGNGHS